MILRPITRQRNQPFASNYEPTNVGVRSKVRKLIGGRFPGTANDLHAAGTRCPIPEQWAARLLPIRDSPCDDKTLPISNGVNSIDAMILPHFVAASTRRTVCNGEIGSAANEPWGHLNARSGPFPVRMVPVRLAGGKNACGAGIRAEYPASHLDSKW